MSANEYVFDMFIVLPVAAIVAAGFVAAALFIVERKIRGRRN